MAVLGKLLGGISGDNSLKLSDQLLFDKIIGFRNIVPGCGASTIVQNLAIALAEHTSYNICVLDTNFMYPMQYTYLVNSEEKTKKKDILDFMGDLSEIMLPTNYSNIYIVELTNRDIADMLSGKDDRRNIENVMTAVKSYFDVVLVDLSSEYTNTNIYSAIKCNKIYQVGDTSLKCIYNLKKSMNLMATLAVPMAKANKVIINKNIEGLNTGIEKALKEVGLELTGYIPFSEDIYRYGITGRKIYGGYSESYEVDMFKSVMDILLDDMVEKTPLNNKYLNVKTLLENKSARDKQEELQADYLDVYSTPDVDDFYIEELDAEEYERLKNEEDF